MRATPEAIVIWEQRINQRNQSGMSIAKWCKENKINKGQYQYWNKKLNKNLTINDEAEFADVSSILSNSTHLNKTTELSKKDDLFDAVLVVDIDRLGRGKSSDVERIKKAFIDENKYLCVGNSIMNLTNDTDDTSFEMQAFLARMEYKTITKRLRRGKKLGAKDGKWTNGIPPYPYEYQKWGDKFNEKSLVVNDDKLKIYRGIIDSVLTYKTPLTNIAYDLNRRGIPSPKNKKWTGVTVGRLLVDETHLGMIVTNKTTGDGRRIGKKPSDAKQFKRIEAGEQNKVNGKHEAVKTQEEHECILIFLKRDTKTPRRSAVKRILPFTGLIKCQKCGYTMVLQDRKDYPGTLILKKCWHSDFEGIKCANRGGPINVVLDVVNQEITRYEDKILKEINGVDDSYVRGIEESIREKEAMLKTKNKALTKVNEAFESDAYTLNEFKSRKGLITGDIAQIKDDIKILRLRIKHVDTKEGVTRLSIIKEFKDELSRGDLANEELNKLYKTIIESIVWNRDEDDIRIEINFL